MYARLVKKCPWVVPHWPSRTEGQSREEYEKSTGQLADEGHADYIRRMLGIVRMYFAVLALPLGGLVGTLPARPSGSQLIALVPDVWRLPAAWSWIGKALTTNLAKHPATGPLILAHLETVCPALIRAYGPPQVGKLLETEKRGIEKGSIRCDTAATRSNIQAAVAAWEQTCKLPAPKGIDW